MRWFSSTAKAVGRLATRHSNTSKQCKPYSKCNYDFQIRRLSSIKPSSFNSIRFLEQRSVPDYSGLETSPFVQKRAFFGVGDDDGADSSKVYEEKRVLGYSPEQLFAVVSAVDMYEGFVPWCQSSKILRRFPDGSFDAELVVGYKFLVESYVSHVEMKKPSYVKTTVSESALFDHLINIWEFTPGAVPGTSDVYFLVDFKFQSQFYRQFSNMFFKEVVSTLVSSFDERCRLIYGPGVLLEK